MRRVKCKNIMRTVPVGGEKMNKDEKSALAGMTAKDVAGFLAHASSIQEALIKLGIEFIEKTGQGNIFGMCSDFDSWRFGDKEGFYDDTSEMGEKYEIIYEWYCRGETEDVPYNIPYRVIDDMDGAVASYFEEKARREERVRQRKLAEEQAAAQKKEQEEYEEYLRLKEKFGGQPQ